MKKLNLVVSELDTEKYSFSPDIAEEIRKEIMSLVNEEYLSPKSLAWSMFCDMYLVNLAGQEVGYEFIQKAPDRKHAIFPDTTIYTKMVSELVTYFRSSAAVCCEGETYEVFLQVSDISNVFLESRTTITKILRSEVDYQNAVKCLLNGSWNNFFEVIYACLRSKFKISVLESNVQQYIVDSYQEFLKQYTEEFNKIAKLIEPCKGYYQTYYGELADIQFRAWSMILDVLKGEQSSVKAIPGMETIVDYPDYIHRAIYELNQNYIGHYSIPFDTVSIWNMLYNVYNAGDDIFRLRNYLYLFSTPSSKWASFYSSCHSFVTERQFITQGLLSRYYNWAVSNLEHSEVEISCSRYYNDLLLRKFPPIAGG